MLRGRVVVGSRTRNSDGFFEAGSIGDIKVANSDPNVIYVGTIGLSSGKPLGGFGRVRPPRAASMMGHWRSWRRASLSIENQIVQSESESGQDNLNFPPKLDNQSVAL